MSKAYLIVASLLAKPERTKEDWNSILFYVDGSFPSCPLAYEIAVNHDARLMYIQQLLEAAYG